MLEKKPFQLLFSQHNGVGVSANGDGEPVSEQNVRGMLARLVDEQREEVESGELFFLNGNNEPDLLFNAYKTSPLHRRTHAAMRAQKRPDRSVLNYSDYLRYKGGVVEDIAYAWATERYYPDWIVLSKERTLDLTKKLFVPRDYVYVGRPALDIYTDSLTNMSVSDNFILQEGTNGPQIAMAVEHTTHNGQGERDEDYFLRKCENVLESVSRFRQRRPALADVFTSSPGVLFFLPQLVDPNIERRVVARYPEAMFVELFPWRELQKFVNRETQF